MFTNREAAKDRLETAEKAYRQLEDRKDVNDSVRERVLVGLARVAECHCDGTDDSMNTAIAAWRSVLTAFPDSKTFKSIAEARIKRLESRDSREFYAWFSTQNPKPGDDLLMPQDGGPGPIPATPFNAFPDLGLSGPGQATPNAGALATPSDGDATKEKSEEEKQPDDQPAADAPSDSPATPDPASEAPANEAPAGEKSANDTPVDPPASDEPASDTSVPEKSGE